MRKKNVQIVYAKYNTPFSHESITIMPDDDPWWIDIIKLADGTIDIIRTESLGNGKTIDHPALPDVREYNSEEGRFQLSTIWEDELDMNFVIQCQVALFPLLDEQKYTDELQMMIEY